MKNVNWTFHGILFVVLGLSLIILLPSIVCSQEIIEKRVMQFSQKALKSYVNNVVNEKNFAKFGFKSLKEGQVARLGDPYRVMYIGLKNLKTYKAGTGVKPLLIDAKTLWFPVMVEGQTRTKLEIVEKDGKWISGEFGGIRTVQEICMVKNQLPMLFQLKEIKSPSKPILVKIPALYAMFLYVESPSGELFIPAMIQPQRFTFQNGEIYAAGEVLSKLREFAREIDENKVM